MESGLSETAAMVVSPSASFRKIPKKIRAEHPFSALGGFYRLAVIIARSRDME
jgi:hypothetical protein